MNGKRDRAFWYRFFADLGWMIFPGGFIGDGTTEWLRFTYGANEPIAWLCTPEYEVRCQGIFAWFEEEDILSHLDLLRAAHEQIERALLAANIQLDRDDKENPANWRWHKPDLQKLSSRTLRREIKQLVFLLEAILAEMNVKERSSVRPGYSEYLTHGFCWLTITQKPAP